VKLLAAERAIDTVVWQMLASVAIPGYTIHTVVAIAHAGLAQLEATPQLQVQMKKQKAQKKRTAPCFAHAILAQLEATPQLQV